MGKEIGFSSTLKHGRFRSLSPSLGDVVWARIGEDNRGGIDGEQEATPVRTYVLYISQG